MESSGTATVAEKTAEELRREIEELDRQQREINDRIRDPRGLRRGGLAAHGITNGPPRNFGDNGAAIRQRGFIRPAERSDDQPAPKRRLSSAVVKVKEDGEVTEDGSDEVQDSKEKQSTTTTEGDANGNNIAGDNDRNPSHMPPPPRMQRRGGFLRRDGGRRPYKMDDDIPSKDIPRVLPKDNDPSLVSRNKRMLGSLLGTLEKFQKEDMHLSATEAYMRRSTSLQRAEQRAREESEKLRQQEREKIAENRRRDLTLRARVAAKAEEKKLELLFIQWSQHQKLLGNYLRTKSEPHIYYLPVKPLVEEDETVVSKRKEEVFQDWKAKRREELTEYQKKIGEEYLAKVETELDRWQNRNNNTRRGNNINLQETMDKELETHQLEHGPKTRKIPEGNNEDEDDVEDINVTEDDIMDDVLVDVVGVDPKPDE